MLRRWVIKESIVSTITQQQRQAFFLHRSTQFPGNVQLRCVVGRQHRDGVEASYIFIVIHTEQRIDKHQHNHCTSSAVSGTSKSLVLQVKFFTMYVALIQLIAE